MAVAGLALAVTSTARASDKGHAAAEQVNGAIYQYFMNSALHTHAGQNRGPNGAQHDATRDNIHSHFQSFGLATTLDTFTYDNQTWENVVAEQTGTLFPSAIYIIAGHYDSAGNPGADDNASGVALVLEAARILSQYPSSYTIRYIAFDMNELGLIGSDHYASNHAGEDIRGMLALDMVAYDPNTNHALIYGRTESSPLKNALAAALAQYGGLTCTINGQTSLSDHASFEAQNFQACLLTEGQFWNNPYYHTQDDNYEVPGYLNWSYAVKMTRGAVGWLVDAAGVDVPTDTLAFTYPYGLPESSSPTGGAAVRVAVTGIGTAVPKPGTGRLHYNTGAGWQDVPLTAASANAYNALLPPAPCGTELRYYFSAQTTDGRVFVDPRLAPTIAHSAPVLYTETVTLYTNQFDANPIWPLAGQWAFGHPTGRGGLVNGNPDPIAGATGTNVYGVNLNGDYSLAATGPFYLTLGPLDLHDVARPTLHFQRWLNTDVEPYVYALIDVSSDASTWTRVWSNGTDPITETAWSAQEYDISAVMDSQATAYIRWGYLVNPGGFAYSGWNIDDVAVVAHTCTCPWPRGDLNCDGTVNLDDINPFVLQLTNVAAWQATYAGCNPANGDINADGMYGQASFGDINAFVTLLAGG